MKVNLEKQLQKLSKRGLTKRASDLQEYLFGKQRKFFGNLSYKLEDYGEPKEKLAEDCTTKDWQKEERLREGKHLRAYLKGGQYFQHGWRYTQQGYKIPNMLPVTLEEIKKENNEEMGNTDTNEKGNTESGTK